MKKKAMMEKAENTMRLCDNLDFILHEEYRLLRTNLMFSMSDEKKCHCIGITSSVKGEGKTTTAINLAYTLAENGEKVCIVEADMRLPTIKKKLGLKLHKGLSEFLTSQANDVIEKIPFKACSIYCVQAGTIPPNPAELLSSQRMSKLIAALEKDFTYIIVDLPPVTLVSDALIVGPRLDGLLVAVSQAICTKKLLKETMRQLALSRVRVIGFVRTFTNDEGFSSYKYRKKKYRYDRNYRYQKYEYASHGEEVNIDDGDGPVEAK